MQCPCLRYWMAELYGRQTGYCKTPARPNFAAPIGIPYPGFLIPHY